MTPSASGTRTRLEPDVRREQILKVARRLFSENTYANVSTVEIAKEAGVARGLLNHHFGTKRDLYLEVVKELTRVPPPIVPATEGRPRDEVLAEGVELWLETVERNRNTWLAAISAEGFGRDQEVQQIVEKTRQVTTDQVLELTGLPRDDEVSRAAVRAYAGLAEAATTEWLNGGPLNREQLRVLLTDSLIALIEDVLPKLR